MTFFYKNKKQKQTSFVEEFKQMIYVLAIVFLIRTFFFGLYQVPTGSMETTMLVGDFFFADKFSYLFSKPKRGHIISLNSPLFAYSDNKFKRLFEEYVWGPQNLTKRIIGVPGDLVEGKIEDGKPVIYLNGSKLDEPYLNKYPLIAVWKRDPYKVAQEAQQEGISLLSQNQLTPAQFEQFMQRKIRQDYLLKSYDPAVPYDKQPFYYIKESLIYKDQNGNPTLIYPGTLIDESNKDSVADDKNHWDGSDVFRVQLGTNQYWLMGDNRLNSGDSRLFGPVDGRLIHGRILFRILSIDNDHDWKIVSLLIHPFDTRIRWSRFPQWVS